MNMNKNKLSVIVAAVLATLSASTVFASEVSDNPLSNLTLVDTINTTNNPAPLEIKPLFQTPEGKVVEQGNEAKDIKKATESKSPDVEVKPSRDMSVFKQTEVLDELTNAANLGEIELTVLNQQLQKKELLNKINSDEISDLIEKAKYEAVTEFRAIENGYVNEIQMLRDEIKNLKVSLSNKAEAAEKKSKASGFSQVKLFVTEVSGVGKNLTATLYYNGVVHTAYEGSVINDGIKVNAINSNGVLISNGAETKFVSITSEEFAYSKMYPKDIK